MVCRCIRFVSLFLSAVFVFLALVPAVQAKAPEKAYFRVINETGKTISRVCVSGRYAAKFAPYKGVDWKGGKCWTNLRSRQVTAKVQAKYNYGFGTTGQNFWHVFAYFSDGTGVAPRWSGNDAARAKKNGDWKQCSLSKADKGKTLSIRLRPKGVVLYDMPGSSDCKQSLKRYAPVSSRSKVYNIAHMTNTIGGLNWALSAGANAVEADLKFDRNGNATEFHHGSPCDCTAAPYGICRVQKGCNGKTGAIALLNQMAAGKSKIALVIVDSKLDKKWSRKRQTLAGEKIVGLLDREFFGKGYVGNVIVGAPYNENAAYILTAKNRALKSRFAGKYYFTIDGEAKNYAGVMRSLKSVPADKLAYGTGIAAIAPGSYFDQIRQSTRDRATGKVAMVYIWTIDKKSSMRKYLRSGVDGVMTNDPAALRDILRNGGPAGGGGIRLARPGDPLR